MNDSVSEFSKLSREDQRRYSVLFNDVSKAPGDHLRFGQRQQLTDYLWARGWRRDVREEDINDYRGMRDV